MTEGEDALSTMIKYLNEGMGPLDAYTALDDRWPGKGWDIEANKLRQLRSAIAQSIPARYQKPSVKERPPRVVREFADVHEKAEFYRRLFSGEIAPDLPTGDPPGGIELGLPIGDRS